MAEETKPTAIKHLLVPPQEVMKKEDISQLLSRYNIRKKQLPQISKKDPSIEHLECEEGDVIKIDRKSQTAGSSTFFRVVVG